MRLDNKIRQISGTALARNPEGAIGALRAAASRRVAHLSLLGWLSPASRIKMPRSTSRSGADMAGAGKGKQNRPILTSDAHEISTRIILTSKISMAGRRASRLAVEHHENTKENGFGKERPY